MINGKLVFGNGPRSLPKNPPDCTIWNSWVFDNFKLADELFAKALSNFETCVSVSNSLYGKLVSLLEWLTIFVERCRVTSLPFFVADFNLLSCELDNFTLTLLYWVFSLELELTEYLQCLLPFELLFHDIKCEDLCNEDMF